MNKFSFQLLSEFICLLFIPIFHQEQHILNRNRQPLCSFSEEELFSIRFFMLNYELRLDVVRFTTLIHTLVWF